MATELRSIPVNAINGPLDRRLHDIGWGSRLLAASSRIWRTDLPVLAILSPHHRRKPCGQTPLLTKTT